MEKQKKAISNLHLLRLGSIASGSHPESEPAQKTVIEDETIGMDYDEIGSLPKKFPAFENAFKSFLDELNLYSIFYDSESISSELEERIAPNNLLQRVIKRNNAEADIQKIKRQLDSYVERFGKALKEIERMEGKNKPRLEIEKKKGELFAGIVMKFDAETEEFGDFTYEFALKRLYIDFMQVANMNGMHGWDIFDYFSMSEVDPKYRREVYEELIENIHHN